MINRIINWLVTTKLLLWARRIPKEFLHRAKGVVIYYNINPDGSEIFNLIDTTKKEIDMPINYVEAYQIFVAVRSANKIRGDIAEIGVYRGGSAKLICEARKDKPLHLFDTFEGMPEVDKEIDLFHYKGQLMASFEQVQDYLKEYKDVYFYKGTFPMTAEPIKDKSFSFVHLDVDIYKSTMDCLNFFYPRMNDGGGNSISRL